MFYPSTTDIVRMNQKVLDEIKVKKADAHKVLSVSKLDSVLEGVRATKGGTFQKAAFLLKGLVQSHSFASGNRRTAYASMLNFLELNGKTAKSDEGENARILQGIREDYYTLAEIQEWLEHGKIRDFKRE